MVLIRNRTSLFAQHLVTVLIFGCAQGFAAAQAVLPEKDTGNLGEIRQSILSEYNFQRIYGNGWVPLDGRFIRDSDLYREGYWTASRLPDARGQFLRCFDDGSRSDGKGNPEAYRLDVGQTQNDQIRAHTHGIRMEYGPKNPDATTACPPGSQYNYVNGNKTYGFFYNGTISNEGGVETRPRCMIVSTFIKINRTPETQASTNLGKKFDEVFKKIENIPSRIFRNEAFQQILRRFGT